MNWQGVASSGGRRKRALTGVMASSSSSNARRRMKGAISSFCMPAASQRHSPRSTERPLASRAEANAEPKTIESVDMANASVEKRIAALRDELNHHNHLYFVESRPQISDREYDALMHEL